MNGARSKAERLLADPAVTTVVVEHQDRLGRMNVELVEAALSATGRRLAVLDDGESLPTDPAWTGRLAARLPEAARGVLLGVNAMVAEAMQKASLHSTTGAVAVDMESHIVARVARRHRLPFAAARVISDAAHHDLPPAVLVGMKSDGEMDLPAVLRSLLANPGQLPALIRTGLEAERGFRALLRGHRRLGPRLGGPDLA